MQHEEIRQAVRRFAQEQLAPNAARWDREKHFPKEALKGLAAMGLYGVAIAEGVVDPAGTAKLRVKRPVTGAFHRHAYVDSLA